MKESPFPLPVKLPADAEGWRMRDGEIASYAGEALYGYMDGPAEIYRAYDYARAWVVRYVSDKRPEITFELFDMGSPDNAMGVFSHNRAGDEAGVGQGSEYQGNVLIFWQNRYFACVSSFSSEPEVKMAVFELGRKAAPFFGEPSALPPLFAFLPEKGLEKNSVRYFSKPSCLQYHYYIQPADMFGLTGLPKGLFAEYPDASLLLILYPDDASAEAALTRVQHERLHSRRTGRLLITVLKADREESAKALLAAAAENAKGKIP